MAVPGKIGFDMWIDERGHLSLFRDRLAPETGIPLLISTTRNGENVPAYDGVEPEGGLADSYAPRMLGC